MKTVSYYNSGIVKDFFKGGAFVTEFKQKTLKLCIKYPP